MAEIKKIKYEQVSGNVITGEGQEFYPVTTTKAVYDTGTTSLYSLIHNGYNESNGIFANGIYAWLEHLENKFASYATNEYFNTLNERISSVSDSVSNIASEMSRFETGINSKIDNFVQSINQRVNFTFDAEPTSGSTNLVLSGGIYSYVERVFNQIKRANNTPYKQVVDMATYSAFDSEIVLYVGETTQQYEKGSLYQYNVTASGDDPDDIICNPSMSGDITITGTWTKVGSIIDGGETADLSNYYTKTEVNNLLATKSDTDTTYTGDGTTVSIDANNVIRAIIPSYIGDGTTISVDPITKVISLIPQSTDLSNYYNKTQVNNFISELEESIPNIIQGTGITISKSGRNVTISSSVSPTPMPDMNDYYTADEIDVMLEGLEPVTYTGDGTTVNIDANNVISAVIPSQNSYAVTGVSTNVHVATSTTGNLTEFKVSVDEPTSNDGTLTIKQGDVTLGTFSANQSSDVEVDIPESELVIRGDNGDVVYHDGNNVFAQKIMCDGYVVTTAEELAECKNASPSFADVFATWKKFSHLDANDNAVSADLQNWYYDSTLNTVIQPNNSTSYNGFISPKSYSTYDISVRVYSTDGDDDTIGLVAAFAKDSNGKEHTLSFVRAANGTGGKTWVAVLDYRAFSLTSTANGQAIIIDKSDTAPTSGNGWSNLGSGSVINMTRNGNVFTAKCSQFNSNTIDSSTLITIDLDTWSNVYPSLELFKGKAPWGYSNFSQAQSKYENISIPNDNFIFDLVNDEVLLFNFNTKLWEVMPNTTPIEAIGTGRFSYNDITDKLFYNDGSNVILVSKQSSISVEQSDWNESNSSSDAYIKNKPALFSGNYADLSNKPTLFSGSYNDLTNKPTIPKMQVVADEATYNAMTKDANTLYLIPAAV